MVRTRRQQLGRHIVLAAAYMFANIVAAAAHHRMQIIKPVRQPPKPYHTSRLSGAEWVKELIGGHPDRIKTELGVRLHVFKNLVTVLRACGLKVSKHLSCEEQVAIFLYASVTALSTRHLGERFQHSNGTISRYEFFIPLYIVFIEFYRYFRRVLLTLISPTFYNSYVHLPDITLPIPPEISINPRFSLYFDGPVGGIDGTQIDCVLSLEERDMSHNRKGGVTQNTLACCSFDLKFQYFLSGAAGASSDATLFNDARTSDLRVPQGRYFLADGGFPGCDALLIPYRRVRYHLAEWSRANLRYVAAYPTLFLH